MAINPRTLLSTAFTAGGTNIFADFRANETSRSPKRYNKLTTLQNGGIPWDSTPCFSLIAHALILNEDNSATAARSKTQPALQSSIYFFRKTDMAFMGFSNYSLFNGTDNTGLWGLQEIDSTQYSQSQWVTVVNPQPMPTSVTTTATTQSVSLQISTGPVANPTPSSRGSVLTTIPATISYQEVAGQAKIGLSETINGISYNDSFFIDSSSKLVKYVGTNGPTTKTYIRY